MVSPKPSLSTSTALGPAGKWPSEPLDPQPSCSISWPGPKGAPVPQSGHGDTGA